MAAIPGLKITELDPLVEQNGTELFVMAVNPSGVPVNKKVVGDYLPLRAQVMFTVPGTLSVNTDAAPWFICSVPGGLQLLGAAVAAKTASTGASIIVDIELSIDEGTNWYSIFSSRPTLSSGDKYNEGGTLSITYIEQGDILRLAVDQVGSTVAGADLTASLWVRQGGTGTAVTTTTISTTSTTTLTSTSISTSSTTTTMLAWQSPVSVHSVCGYYPGQEPSYLIDGHNGSCWIHLVDEPHWIIVDLGSTKYVTKIRLYVYGNQDQSQWRYYSVYISDDPANWGSPLILWGTFLGGEYGAEWVEQALAVPKAGRYLKLVDIETQDILNHVMGAEFHVYAS